MHSIRIATPADIDTIIKLVRLGIEEMNKGVYPIEDEILEARILQSFETVPCFLVSKDGEDIGVASLTLGYQVWSTKPYLTTNMVHVLREHRNFDIIKSIYEAIRQYADLQGILYIDNFYCTDKVDGRARLAEMQKLDVVGLSILYKGEK